MRKYHMGVLLLACLVLPATARSDSEGWRKKVVPVPADSTPFVMVLGIAQDGGAPQLGSKPRAGAKETERWVVSLAVVDPADSSRWLLEATPDLREQLRTLDSLVPVGEVPGIDGIFLTHAHIGHYTGLMYLGHESLGASGVPVYALPRMTDFLRFNGPWSQLVDYGNVELRAVESGRPVELNGRISVTAFEVPHRQEFSEVAGFRIDGPNRSVLFIPDIDSWTEWDSAGTRVEDLIREVDIAYLDGTFFANGEIPGRDMSGFPHPFITHSMTRFADLSPTDREKIRFIHLNHTNPALAPASAARRRVEEAGFRIAERLERVGL